MPAAQTSRQRSECASGLLLVTDAAWPRVLRYRKLSHQETPHEIHLAAGLSVTVCASCLTRPLNHDWIATSI